MQEQIVYQRVVYVQFMMSVEEAKPSNLSVQLTECCICSWLVAATTSLSWLGYVWIYLRRLGVAKH
jgi:hypothetical protein